MSNNTQPEIRFPGFTEDWEERKLRDITERVRGNDGRMDLPTLTISASSGWLDQRDRFSGNIAGKEQKNYTLLKKGQLSYNHGNSKLAKYGVVCELTTYDEALVPRVYHSFDTNELASSNFIEYMFATKRPDRELAKLVSSGARMDGLLNINFDEFMGINVSVPSVEEQQKIGTFFKQIDDTIALHQSKLDLLKETKKGFLQKMFPKNGAKVPEIRFPGFTEDWEERKLSELAEVKTGFPFKNDDFIDGGNYLVITNGNIQNNSALVDGNIGNRISAVSDEIKDKYLLNYGDILVTMDGTVGRTAKVFEKNQILAQRVGRLVANTTPEFLYQWLNTGKFFGDMTKVSHGGTIKHISLSEISDFNAFVPVNEDERVKIGSLLLNIDKTITLHQRKLDLLKEMKKGFLQKMFV
ncbi:restriction endonuclease subunit S [Enterococcus faecium]|uniref:restriction endonuclease subunit S n=1 Tax=Enterococcus faecium TaxID=1352 RepID=UPI0022FD4AA0|nr:restriction endonuclease subunit S [Enterococcus faecium]WBY89555.1 restriction endonuclease subunit S [Enterococcus faecium]